MRQFQASIESIQHQVSQLNPELTKQQVQTSMSAIDRAHTELAKLDARVDEIALAQLSDVAVDAVKMRAQKLAELVVAGREQHGWFEDEVTLAPEHAPPLSEDEAGQLREVRRKLGADLIYASARIPSADVLPQAKAVATLHQVLSKMKEIEMQIADGELLPLKAITPAVLETARELVLRIDEAATGGGTRCR